MARMVVATAGDVPTYDRRVAEFDWTAERLRVRVRELGDGWSDPAAQVGAEFGARTRCFWWRDDHRLDDAQ
jgi:hypothetical protein